MKLYTKQGILKYKTDCAPNNGYFLIPLYDKVEIFTFNSLFSNTNQLDRK